MATFKLHDSGEITPVRVHEKIDKLITDGYQKKQAVAIAYREARHDWGLKHAEKVIPPWLDFGDAKKNPVRLLKKHLKPDESLFKVAISLDKSHWTTVASFNKLSSAKQYATALKRVQPYHYIKVFEV